MSDRAAALEHKAERSRNRLSDLMDDLQQQVSPREMLFQAVGDNGTGNGINNLGRLIGEQISRNPLPFLLIAAGVGWLMFSDRTSRVPAKREPVVRKRVVRRRKRKSARKAAAPPG
jgi:hypothetical protein